MIRYNFFLILFFLSTSVCAMETPVKKLKKLTISEKKEIDESTELNEKLFKALRNQKFDACKQLLKAGANANSCKDGKVALDYARHYIHPLDEEFSKFVSLLRAYGAKGRPDYHFKVYSQLTPEEHLMLKVEKLCKRNSCKLYGGNTQKALQALDKLMYKSPAFNIATEQKDIQFLQAIKIEENKKAIVLLKEGAHVNIHKGTGITALLFAAYYNNLKLVQTLLDSGANPNLGESENLTTPLHAVGHGVKSSNQPAIMKLLLDRGARMYITLSEKHLGCTPLSWVTYFNPPKIAESLTKMLLTYVQREDAPWGTPIKDVVNNLLERNKLLLLMGAKGTFQEYRFRETAFESVKDLLDPKKIEQYRETITEHVKIIQGQRLHFLLVLNRKQCKLKKKLLVMIDNYLPGVGLPGDELPPPAEN